MSPSDNESTAAAATRIALPAILDFLGRHAPFDQMSGTHREHLAQHLHGQVFEKGVAITGPHSGPANHLYIIRRGRVRGECPGNEGQHADDAWELTVGESFPVGALLERRAVRTLHRAVDETECLVLERSVFDDLVARSDVFRDFCTRRLSSLLDEACRQMQADTASRISGDTSLNIRLVDRIRRAPIVCGPQASLRSVLRIMEDERIGSIIVTDDAMRPLGVFTLHDLLSRVALPEVPLDTAVVSVATPDPLALPPNAFAFEAAMMMATHGIGHICIVEQGRLQGVVSERDLFSLQRVGLVNLSRSINRAPDLATLTRLVDDIHELVGQMIAQGVDVVQVSRIITLLNDHVVRRVIRLCMSDAGPDLPAFTWIAFGSEGREEQTLKTDQDNGILFVPPAGRDAASVRSQLLPLARRINDALAACGYPLCPGNVMASNPECCLSADEWRARFAQWVEQGTGEHLLKATIYFDLRVIEGPAEQVDELRRWLFEKVRTTPRFLRLMAQNAMRNRPPLGLLRDFIVSDDKDHPNTIDLKLNGLTPFVDGARILSLAHGIEASNTLDRLTAAGRAAGVRPQEVEAWRNAYVFVQLLRVQHQWEQQKAGDEVDNRVNPDTLNELDRRILKESFRQARKLQARLELDYQL